MHLDGSPTKSLDGLPDPAHRRAAILELLHRGFARQAVPDSTNRAVGQSAASFASPASLRKRSAFATASASLAVAWTVMLFVSFSIVIDFHLSLLARRLPPRSHSSLRSRTSKRILLGTSGPALGRWLVVAGSGDGRSGAKFTRKKEEAIARCSRSATSKRLRVVGVAPNTLLKWMKHPEFDRAYREAVGCVRNRSLGYSNPGRPIDHAADDGGSQPPASTQLRAADIVLGRTRKRSRSKTSKLASWRWSRLRRSRSLAGADEDLRVSLETADTKLRKCHERDSMSTLHIRKRIEKVASLVGPQSDRTFTLEELSRAFFGGATRSLTLELATHEHSLRLVADHNSNAEDGLRSRLERDNA